MRRQVLGEYSADGSDQAGFGFVEGHVGDVPDVWPNEVVQRLQVGRGVGPVREGYKVIALFLKPSLGFFGFVGRRRVLLPHPGSATGQLIGPGDHHTLQHIQVHFGVDFQADFDDVRWHDVALTWNHTKDHNRSRKLCFDHPGHVAVIRGNPPMVTAVITWIGREHDYTAALLLSRSLNIVSLSDMIEGSYPSWYTTGQLGDGLQQKRIRFSLNGNGIMSSFLGRQCFRSTM